MIKLSVNGQAHDVDVEQDMPLLWVLRDILNLTGTKYGCGIAQCGACTVHVNGQPTRACVTEIGDVAGAKITTIEATHKLSEAKHIRDAWKTHQVPQCGYCQSGQIMSAVALLKEVPKPTDKDIDDAMSGNICRCGTYQQIRAAIHDAAKAAK